MELIFSLEKKNKFSLFEMAENAQHKEHLNVNMLCK